MKLVAVLLGLGTIACASPRTHQSTTVAPKAEVTPAATAEKPAVAATDPSVEPATTPKVEEPAVQAPGRTGGEDRSTSFSWTLDEGERSTPMPVRCMYNVKTDRYGNCMAAGQGRCRHFGVPCNAEGKDDRRRPCLYDAKQDRYRQCLSVHAGRCLSFSMKGCAPGGGKRACVYNARQNAYRRCANMANGRCQHYAEPCSPEQTPE